MRQARGEKFPDPVQAAALVELGGADGITVHLRQDRRHINERDVLLLRETVQTELTVEMAATEEMIRFACKVKPDQVTLVPELTTERTTTRGLNLLQERRGLKARIGRLQDAGVRVSLFIEPDPRQVEVAVELGAEGVELCTDRYCRSFRTRPEFLEELAAAGQAAREAGLVVHAGHGLDYLNIVPILRRGLADGFSIGFAIVARAVFVGLRAAVAEMKRVIEVNYGERK